MRTKTFLLLFISSVFCLSLIGCSQSDTINGKQLGKPLRNVLSIPDRIILYNQGTQKEIDKSSDNFKKILDLTNKRFHDKLSTARDIIDDNGVGAMNKDGIGLEFIYDEVKELSIKGDGFQPFKYNKLYFQITSDKSGNAQGSRVHTLQYGDSQHYKGSSRGPLKYLEELVNLVTSIQ